MIMSLGPPELGCRTTRGVVAVPKFLRLPDSSSNENWLGVGSTLNLPAWNGGLFCHLMPCWTSAIDALYAVPTDGRKLPAQEKYAWQLGWGAGPTDDPARVKASSTAHVSSIGRDLAACAQISPVYIGVRAHPGSVTGAFIRSKTSEQVSSTSEFARLILKDRIHPVNCRTGTSPRSVWITREYRTGVPSTVYP